MSQERGRGRGTQTAEGHRLGCVRGLAVREPGRVRVRGLAVRERCPLPWLTASSVWLSARSIKPPDSPWPPIPEPRGTWGALLHDPTVSVERDADTAPACDRSQAPAGPAAGYLTRRRGALRSGSWPPAPHGQGGSFRRGRGGGLGLGGAAQPRAATLPGLSRWTLLSCARLIFVSQKRS